MVGSLFPFILRPEDQPSVIAILGFVLAALIGLSLASRTGRLDSGAAQLALFAVFLVVRR
jgi:hypothetical protein